jgi:hypothetical protein
MTKARRAKDRNRRAGRRPKSAPVRRVDAQTEQRRPTAYEVALKVGLIDCAAGPEDLSTNSKR